MEASPIVQLRLFFSTGKKPVDVSEMMGFWKVCSDSDKEQFKAEIAKWDGKSEFVR